ncbi:fluoroquinolone transport system permease protein [Micromonospora sp. Llam0]|uniref:ABC transporter permease n=1 Tax=Micromonospora sp. Llam0 TaxID=2485143 RepID=UPI000F49EC22|nr:ABC transporter permease [Micromonospora sp. Llam0]ROO50880.1 fluoroquinolone transport system permease protein [Micromonospora sp. Llam0]
MSRPARWRRLVAAVALETRIEWRYRIVPVALAFAAVWTLLLLIVPAPAARVLGPILLLVDTAAFGALFIALLLLNERAEGALAALRVTPLRTGEQLAAKLGVLTALSVVAAVPIAIAAARPGRPGVSLPGSLAAMSPGSLAVMLFGVALTALLILSAALLLVLSQRTVTGYLTTMPLVLLPGLVAPLVYLAGLLDHPAAYLVPTTGTAELIRAGATGQPWPPGGWWRGALLVGYAVAWAGGSTLLAVRRFRSAFATPAAGTRRGATAAGRPSAGPGWPPGWLPALIRLDLRLLGADRLLLVLLGAPLLLAVALRVGLPPLARFVDQRYGVDLIGHGDLLLALLVLAHVPVIGGMIGSLLLLDDLDERRLLLLRVTPVTVERYLGYRAGVTGLLTGAGLLAAVPLSGLAGGAAGRLVPAALLAAGLAVLILLVVAGHAANKVHGLALLKLLGGGLMALAALPFLPVVAEGPSAVRWLVAVFPPAAVSLTQRSAASGEPWPGYGYAAVGAVVAAVAAGLLARRALARLTS